jgi:hypothetical protein
MELLGRVWYPMKAHHNGHNLSYEAVLQSHFVYEHLQALGLGRQPQNYEEGVGLGVKMVPFESIISVSY